MASIDELKKQAQQMLRANSLHEAKRLLEQIQETGIPDLECWHMLSTVYGMLGEFADAERCSQQMIVLSPDMPEAHFLLGKALHALRRLDEAEAAYCAAIRLKPDFADAYNYLAVLQQQGTGRRNEALSNYRKAISLIPTNMDYLYNLGCILNEMGQIEEAEKAFGSVIKKRPNHAEAHLGLGITYESQGKIDSAKQHYKLALDIKPNFKIAKQRLTMLSRAIPNWHFPMINDEERNSAYDKALRKVITPDSTVLDIGSGSGLLAMMAARAGAKHVYTCEVNTSLAAKAREIIAINGYSDVITVIGKKSTDLQVGVDILERADILVSEILDECVLGEGVIPSVFHAKQHLIKKNAHVIPSGATVYAALVESKRLHDNYCVEKAAGFDLSAFNEFSRAQYTNIRLSTFSYRIISDVIETFHFDLANPDPSHTGEELFSLTVNDKAICHALVYWFSLDLNPELNIDSSPLHDRSHWMQAAYIQRPPLAFEPGYIARARGKYDSVSVRFTIES